MNLNNQYIDQNFKITEGNNSLEAIKESFSKIENSFLVKKKRALNLSIFFSLFLTLTIFGSVAEAIIFANELFEKSAIFGTLYLTLLSGVIYYVLYFIYGEISAIISLKKVDAIIDLSEKSLKDSEKYSVKFANIILQKYSNFQNDEVQNGISAFREEFPNLQHSEILQKIEERVISPIDQEVEKIIFKYAKENGVVTAISPIPLIDLLFLLWRNFRMVREITSIYGYRSGLFGNLILFQRVFEQMIFIGVAELSEEAMKIISGQALASKLSSSIAQGIGHSILTVRVGIATIETARPIRSENKISLIVKFLKTFNPFRKSS
jgi:putative membrane protein